MLAPDPPVPFYLQGNFAPVRDEATGFDLKIDGMLPEALNGSFFRNGPNPRQGNDPGHWFQGNGMVHGVHLREGRAEWYRNRWLRTAVFTEGRRFVRDDFTLDLTATGANTNIIRHAGRYFALAENALPFEVSGELESIGICDFDGKLKTAMTAHPKLCPNSGELHFFGYTFFAPFLTYHVLDAAGALVHSAEIDLPGPVMMHDFALTEKHVIFMDLPVVFSLERALAGKFPYEWSDDKPARLGVLPRFGSNADIRWYDIASCYVFHPSNAYERDGKIVLDVARYPELWRGTADKFTSAALHRWTIDPQAGSVKEEPLDTRAIEFPRIDERLVGKQHRFSYAVSGFTTVGDAAATLVKYDHATGKCQTHNFGAGCAPAEGVFVPASATADEDDGWVLTYVYDATRDSSDFVVLNAQDFAGPPQARVALPQRVPFGFHGNWIGEV